MAKGTKVNIEVNIKDILKRTKQFGKDFEELCNKYGLVPDMAKDNSTNDVYFVVNVKDLIEKKDIKMNVEK